MRFKLAIAAGAATAAFLAATPAMATTGKGSLFHDGVLVGTVVVPAHVPAGGGIDPFYKVMNGAAGQLGIAGVAPGDGPYHGGNWQVWLVTFKEGVTPYLLTSDEAVASARAAGDVTVTRAADADFRCPITRS
jgi:hypothetical protein